jgi:uncharacterized alpha-E superfamily protein
MLSRVANSLYWMSRYLERAENVARILDVNLQLSLDFRSADPVDVQNHWLPILDCTGDQEAFRAQHKTATAAAVTEFMVFDQRNPNSIISSISQARENARTVRDQIPVETWEELNRLYLFALSNAAREMWLASPTDFFNDVKSTSLLLVGLSETTHIHNEGWLFSQLGRFLERADKTSRILDVRTHTLPASGLPKTLNQITALEWSAVLRSASAWDAFKSIYGADVHPRHVTDLLLFNEDFPRSIRVCVEELNQTLRRITGVAEGRYSNDAEKLAGRLTAELRFGTVKEVFLIGLHEYIDQLQTKLNAIGDAIFSIYISHAFEASALAFTQQEEQQQQSRIFDSRRA